MDSDKRLRGFVLGILNVFHPLNLAVNTRMSENW